MEKEVCVYQRFKSMSPAKALAFTEELLVSYTHTSQARLSQNQAGRGRLAEKCPFLSHTFLVPDDLVAED